MRTFFLHPGLALGSLLPSFLGSIRMCVCVKSHVAHLNHLQFQCSLLVIWHGYGIWSIDRWFAYWRCWVSSSQTIKLQVNHLRFWSIWVLSFSRWKLPTITRLCKKCCKFSHPRTSLCAGRVTVVGIASGNFRLANWTTTIFDKSS